MSVQVSETQLAALRSTLLNLTGNVPLHERFRALFMLKAVGTDEVVQIIGEGLQDPSALLKHELAYVLGQIHNPTAVPILETVLRNTTGQHCAMVRHEAAEALGALSSVHSLPLLREYTTDPAREVRETCEIAIGKIEWDQSEEGKARKPNPDFPTIDPAPSSSPSTIPELRNALMNTKLPLFERYRAMFALRDFGAGSKEAVQALATGFKDDSALFRWVPIPRPRPLCLPFSPPLESTLPIPLFRIVVVWVGRANSRHEIAYIFGQLSSPYSIPSLLHVLQDDQEEEMVRHEAAEALGGIASDGAEDDEARKEAHLPPGGVLEILREWAVKPEAPEVVRESCQVAIDMWEYENSTEQFNPLDSIEKAYTTGMERSAAAALAAGVPSH